MTIDNTESRRGNNEETLTEEVPMSLVDTVTITFPIDRLPEDCDHLVEFDPEGDWFSGGPRLWLPRAANLSVQKRTRTGRIQCSVPRVLRGNNLRGAAAAEVVPAFEFLLNEAETHGMTTRLPAIESADVSRVDVCRDYLGAAAAPMLLPHLARGPRLGGAKSALHRDQHGRPETLEVRTKYAWGTKLYMKGACHLRFEGEAKRSLDSDWAQDPDPIHNLGDITDDTVDALGRSLFARAGFGTPIHDVAHLVDAVLALEDETDEAKQKILGNCVALAHDHGLRWISTCDKTRRRMRKSVSKVGRLAETLHGSYRLDWDLGLLHV